MRYKTGTKAHVLQKMARLAIRDQEALIDAYIPTYGEPDEATMREIEDAKNNILDFKLMARMLPNVELRDCALLRSPA